MLGEELEIPDLQKLNEELVDKVKNLDKNICVFLKEAETLPPEQEIVTLAETFLVLKKHHSHLLSALTNSDEKNSPLQKVLNDLKRRVASLQEKFDSQQEQLRRLQEDIHAFQDDVTDTSNYTTFIGSTLGNLLWKVSNLQQVVDLLMTSNKLPELFSLVGGAFMSFFESYANTGLPKLCSNESQFILTMAGLIGNIATYPEVRHLLVFNQAGKALVEQIIKSIATIPDTIEGSTPSFYRSLLMVIYNVSLNEGGFLFLRDKEPLLVKISWIITCDRSPEIRLIAIRILESLTCKYPSEAVYNLHRRILPLIELEAIATGTDVGIRGYALIILRNMRKSSAAFKPNRSLPSKASVSEKRS